eukprot:COSAG05_NODE_497_length_9246_cov_6.935343_12_plen_74_part_00
MCSICTRPSLHLLRWVLAWLAAGESVFQIPTEAATNALAWHPKLPILAYGCDRGEAPSASPPHGVKVLGLGME